MPLIGTQAGYPKTKLSVGLGAVFPLSEIATLQAPQSITVEGFGHLELCTRSLRPRLKPHPETSLDSSSLSTQQS